MNNLIKLFSIALLVSPLGIQAKSPTKAQCVDYVIVGGGTAGCVLARLLSDNFNNKVVMLERGQNYINDPLIEVCSQGVLEDIFTNPKYSENFYARNQIIGSFPVANGRMLGGSLAHNRYLFVRGDQSFDDWADFSGDNRWRLANTLPLEIANETYIPAGTISSPLRGTSGPLRITQTAPARFPFAENLAKILGAPLVDDYNITDLATSTAQLFCSEVNGAFTRSFTAKAYLGDVINQDGTSIGKRQLTVKLGATGTRIIFDNKKATGVEFVVKGQSGRENVCRVLAKKKIILCSGSFYTPQLLMLSGVGPKKVLEENNIPKVLVNEHVGAHLSIHYGIVGTFSGDFPGGPFVSFFNTTTPQGPSRDSQFIVLPGIGGGGGAGSNPSSCITTLAGTTEATPRAVIGWLLFPRSKGNVVLANTNPFTNPFVTFNGYTDGGLDDPNSDASRVVKFFKLMREAAQSVGGESLFPNPADYESDEKLFEDAQISPTYANHYAGTCRMARTAHGENGGVVNGKLEVFGLQNLMIADLSVAPKDPAGNPASAACVIGLEAGRILGATIP
ncbi:GMC family oxidoreductase [Candidatus Dependentiae bacterium]|nr:GMC family oxidoreductase [Candidatus Dependentiae bacterium]